MRSLHTPQQETNVAYNPGVTYRGGEFIAQGISQAGNAITAGLQRFAQNREESAALDMSFQTRAQPLLEEMQKFSAKDGQVSPAASLVDKGADWHKFSSSQKKAFLADVVIMGDKQDRARRQQQEDDFRKAAQQFRQDELTQRTSYQNEMQRLQALSTGATVNNINSEIGLRDRNASQDEAVGQALAAFARGGTNLNPEFSYSDWANRGGGLGNATMPEASTPFTYQQRMDRAMTTPGLGGRGAIQLQDELRKFAPKQATEIDLARMGLYNAQAEAARARAGGGAAFNPTLGTKSVTLADGSVIEIPFGTTSAGGVDWMPQTLKQFGGKALPPVVVTVAGATPGSSTRVPMTAEQYADYQTANPPAGELKKRGDRAALEEELRQHETALKAGNDERYGFGNAYSRQNRVVELKRKLAELGASSAPAASSPSRGQAIRYKLVNGQLVPE